MPETVSGTFLITGANSGLGLATAHALANRGGNVVMACRTQWKCDVEAANVRSLAAQHGSNPTVISIGGLDLGNWSTFDSFFETFHESPLNRIDALLNNAGFSVPAGAPPDAQGFEPHFGAMHLGHFLFTERIANMMEGHLRVVDLSSGTHHLCAIPFYYTPSLAQFLKFKPGCLDDDFINAGIRMPSDNPAYFRAKVSNVLHILELPKHHPQITAIAVDQGWVGTNIQSWMQGPLSPQRLGWMRSPETGVWPVVVALTLDESVVRQEMRDGAGITIDTLAILRTPFSYQWWDSSLGIDPTSMGKRAATLWELSESLTTTGQSL